MSRGYGIASLLLAGIALVVASLALLAQPAGAQLAGSGRVPTAQAPLQGTATPTPCTGWSVVPPAPVVTVPQQLFGAAAASANDVWGVGLVLSDTLTEHWTGSAWARVPSPNGAGLNSQWQAATAFAANDAWAVGITCPNGDCLMPQSLIGRWNGTAWSLVPGPSGTNGLFGVDGVAANDVWAVGTRYNGLFVQTLILRWNGTTWNQVSSPNVGFFPNILLSVNAVAANDVWAVGLVCGDATCNTAQTLALRWNGATWSTVASPNLGSFRNVFTSVAGRAANDAWAVGLSCTDSACNGVQGLVARWSGTQWNVVAAPNPGTLNTHYNAVAVLAANDAWAVGGYSNDNTTFMNGVIHWDGSQWSLVSVPNPGAAVNELLGLAVVSATDIWAVGSQDDGTGARAQILHYTGPCATATPSATPAAASPTATPTRTPAGGSPTATATTGGASPTATSPAGASPTATATACAISFTDVDPNNPFYVFIRCLACRGIVSGYADGTFRWGADVTRGQLSKIIANAAGLSNAVPSSRQTFSDVPNTNTFWLFVERLAGTGAISGYGCGGAGEPCDPQNRPYFRWGANATRGQISKITGVTAGYNGPIPTTQQTFADVPPTNPFWLWIEELASRQIISGYGCGGPGEPCDPQNRPYFRWGANATRGQMSKIAANTFYPNCSTPSSE